MDLIEFIRLLSLISIGSGNYSFGNVSPAYNAEVRLFPKMSWVTRLEPMSIVFTGIQVSYIYQQIKNVIVANSELRFMVDGGVKITINSALQCWYRPSDAPDDQPHIASTASTRTTY